MVYAQPRIFPGEWDAQTHLEILKTNGSLKLSHTTRPYNIQQKKENLLNGWLCWAGWSRSKIERSEKKDKYQYLAREFKKLWNMKVTMIPIVISTVTKGLVTRTGGLGNKKTSRDHPNYNIIKIGRNTEKNPGDLRRLAVAQTPVKNHQLKLMWKTLKRVK